MVSKFAQILLLIASFQAGVLHSNAQLFAHTLSLEELFGGKEAFLTISSPDSVEASLLTRSDIVQSELVTPKISKAFSQALIDDKSHYRVNITHCDPDYGMQIRFKRGNDEVTVDLCLKCKILRITHGKHEVEESFDFEKHHFVKLAKAMFPSDKTIQSLE